MGTLKVEVYPCMVTDKSINQISKDNCCIGSRYRFVDECIDCPYNVKVLMRGGVTRRICVFGLNINAYRWYRSLSGIYSSIHLW